MQDLILQHLLDSMATKKRIIENPSYLKDIEDIAKMIAARMKNGKKLMICGNGGSAADAQHIAAEFTSVLSQDVPRPGLPAIALTTDTSFITANANDYGFKNIFERQVQALAQDGDILLGISTSGNSKNIVNAFKYATGHGVTTIGFLGGYGGTISTLSDLKIIVPSHKVQHIQECHITIGHIVCELVEKEMGYGS